MMPVLIPTKLDATLLHDTGVPAIRCYLKMIGRAMPEGNELKIYTRTGDHGETGLFGGARVRKDDARVEAYGTIDELNAVIGSVIATLPTEAHAIATTLQSIQSELFDIGAELATPPERAGSRLADRVPVAGAAQVAAIEMEIDTYEHGLAPLRTFIMPGGSIAASSLHVARTVARRAERRLVTLGTLEPVNPELLRYLNRLSDLLFVLARAVNSLGGQMDIPWRPRGSRNSGQTVGTDQD